MLHGLAVHVHLDRTLRDDGAGDGGEGHPAAAEHETEDDDDQADADGVPCVGRGDFAQAWQCCFVGAHAPTLLLAAGCGIDDGGGTAPRVRRDSTSLRGPKSSSVPSRMTSSLSMPASSDGRCETTISVMPA